MESYKPCQRGMSAIVILPFCRDTKIQGYNAIMDGILSTWPKCGN